MTPLNNKPGPPPAAADRLSGGGGAHHGDGARGLPAGRRFSEEVLRQGGRHPEGLVQDR